MAGFDISTEKYILGCMTDGVEYIAEVFAELSTDDFTQDEHKHIFELMRSMYQNDEPITQQTFYVKHSGILKELGVHWSRLTDVFATMPGLKAAISKLKGATRARRLLELSDTIRNDLEGGEEPTYVIDKIQHVIMTQDASPGRQYLSSKDMAVKCLEVVAERMDESTRTKKCIYTGLNRLNRVTGGFEAGDLIILSGGTGGGKSAFAANIARDIAIIQKLPCLYINSEMSHEQMALRWTALLGGVKHSSLRSGTIPQEQFTKLAAKLDNLHLGQLHTLTMPDLRIDSVISEIRRFKMQKDIRAAIVDYIGRMDYTDSKNKDDWQVLTGAARRLKTLAQEQEIIIIMLAQLNASGRLAQASYMSHEADLWLNLRKPSDDEIKEFRHNSEPWNMILQINKARNASTGILPVYFFGELLRFTDSMQEALRYEAIAGTKYSA